MTTDRAGAGGRTIWAVTEEAHQVGVEVHGAGLGEVAGEQVQELVQVAAQRAVRCLLDAEVLEGGHAGGAGDAAGDGPDELAVEAGDGGVVVDRDGGQLGQHRVGAAGVAGQELRVDEAFLHHHAEQRSEREGIGARPHLEVVTAGADGEVGGLGAPRVEDDEGAVRVVGDRLQDGAGPGEAVRLPRVLAEEEGDLGVLEVGRGVAVLAAEEATVDPELAGLLLGQGVGGVHGAEGTPGAAAVGAAQVVPLAATAVVEDRRATVGVADRREALGHLGDGGVPVDLLEGAVGRRRNGLRQPLAAVLVVVEAQGLLAGVALRARVGLVPRMRSKRRPSRRTSMPQLMLHRMQAVCCQRSSPAWSIVWFDSTSVI